MDTPAQFPEDALNETAKRLAGWSPAAPALDRDRMLFEAGRASAQTGVRGRVAMIIAADFALLAIALGVWAVREHAERQRVETALIQQAQLLRMAATSPVVVPIPAPVMPNTPPPAADSYLALTHRVASNGLDEPAPTRPVHEEHPAGPRRTLTPLNSRMPGGSIDL